mgnify:CR=1 FL=1
MQTLILCENVLTDNILLLADEGKIFKGGYLAIIKEYEFSNSWSDREKPNKKFRSLNALRKYLKKHYKNFDIDLI